MAATLIGGLLVPGGALAYEYGAVSPLTPGTQVTEPSGLTVAMSATGPTSISSPAEPPSARSAVNANFSPQIDVAAASFRPLVTTAGCPTVVSGATRICSNLGTMTITFSRPVRNPTIHIAGLGGFSSLGASTIRFSAAGSLTSVPAGATLGPALPGSTNLQTAATEFRVSNDIVNTSCATTVTGGSTAGCGSFVVNGTVTSLTFAMSARLWLASGSLSLNPGSADAFNVNVTLPQDQGDAPASYDAGQAATHVISDLRLGASVDEDQPNTRNPTTSANAVAAGANPNSPAGDGADEDAVTTWPVLTTANAGSTYSVTVPIAGLSQAARLCGWIDFDRSGTFAASERACADPGAGAATSALTWNVPTATAAGPLYARLRLGYGAGQVNNPTGLADSGEVEDHMLVMMPVIRLDKRLVDSVTDTVSLRVNGTVLATVGDGGTTGDRTVYHTSTFGAPQLTTTIDVTQAAIPLTVSEIPTAGNENLYGAAVACRDATGAIVASGGGPSASPSIPRSTGTNALQQNITCTFSNVPIPPSILVDKVAGPLVDVDGNGPDAGDRVTYTFTVSNAGGRRLTGVTVTDPKLAGATPPVTVTCATTTLLPLASTTCTSSGPYTLTQADVDAGAVDNTATATGTPPTGPAVSGTDTNSVAVPRRPELTVDKTAGAIADLDGNGPDAGDQITYNVRVTNTGNVTVNPVTVSDPLLGGTLACSATALAPGAFLTCGPFTYTITAGDVTAQVRNNTATAAGTPAGGTLAPATDSTSTPIVPVPRIAVDKTAGSIVDVDANGPDAGDTIAYTFTVTNTGTTTLTGVTVSDPKLAGATPPVTVTCVSTTLTAGASTACNASGPYTISAADVTAGSVDNTATASGTPPTGPAVTATDSTSTAIVPVPRISLDKQASTINDLDSNGHDAGDTITYTFVVTNTGGANVNSVGVSDPTLAGAGITISCAAGVLAPGNSRTCTASAPYVLTAANVDAGTLSNTATASATPVGGGPAVTATDSTTTTITRAAAISLDKTGGAITDVDGNGPDAGDTITYTFVVTNTGNVSLSGIELRDPPVTGATISCPSTTLAAGASMTCSTTTATLTAAEVDAGSRTNTARVVGTPPAGVAGPVSGDDTFTAPVTRTPRIAVDKTAGPLTDLDANGPDAGDTITYGFTVTNTGNVTLTSVALSDSKLGGALTCPAATLAAGASMTCTAVDYALTLGDVDAGAVNNTATVTGTPPTGPAVTGTDSTSTAIASAPAITLTKTADPIADLDGNGPDVDDTITYRFRVTNNGNVTLNPVTVTDPSLGPITCPAGPLAPGANVDCAPASFTLTQGVVDAGTRTNTATATGTPPTGQPVTDQDAVTTTIARSPSIALDKQAGSIADNDANGPDAGDTITYSFTVTNSGNVTLTAVGVTDAKLGTVGCADAVLAPGGTTTCSAAPYVLTQADIDAGSANNTATAAGTAPDGTRVSANDATSTPITAGANLLIDKTADPIVDLDANGPDAGDTIAYRVAVTNSGNVTLSQITATDPLVTLTCPRTSLAPGASMTCTATAPYALTQADVDAGQRTNTATVSAQAPGGATLTRQDTVTVPVSQRVDLVLDKVAGPVVDLDVNGHDAGDRITFTFRVRNDGNVVMSAIALTDPLLGGAIACPQTTLGPGASMDCTATQYTLTQANIDAGGVTNTARVDANAPPAAGGPTFTTDSTGTPVIRTPAITLVKTASALVDTDGNGDDAGDRVDYTLVVTNTGTVTLTTVAVSDPGAGAITCPPTTTLAPGASITCSASRNVTQAEVDAGRSNNTATASGTPPVGPAVTSTDRATTPISPVPAISLDKSASAIDDVDSNGRDAGDTITYSFTVTNTGNVTLTAVGVSDNRVGPVTCGATTLAVGASTTCTAAPYVLTQPEVDAGITSNTATATGTPPSGPAVTSTDGTTTAIPPGPAMTIDKSAGALVDVDGNGPDAGDTITYGFSVLNTGTVTLSAITVTDPLLGAISCPTGSVAPGGVATCSSVTYTLTQGDVDAGVRGNTASVDATPPLPAPIEQRSDSTSTVIPREGNVTIDKVAGAVTDTDGNGQDAGDTITYTFRIANTGNVTLSSVAVNDPRFGALTCPTTLAPGTSADCTAQTLTLTQAQVDGGVVNNTATVTANTPMGTTVTDADSTSTPIGAAPVLTLDKTASAVNDIDGNGVDAGDTIVYGFSVRNGGNVTLSALDVSDSLLGAVTCPPTTLAPGETVACASLTHTLTQAEINTGLRQNTATASADTPGGETIVASDTVDSPLTRSPAIVLDKVAGPLVDADGNGADVGDSVTFTFRVTNTGNISLLGIVLTDPRTGPLTCPATTLDPGASMDCSPATVTVTLAEMNEGAVRNTAAATADTPYGASVISRDSTVTTLGGVAAITLDKSAGQVADLDGNGPDPGDTITYGFTVTNTGTVSLDGVAVSDPLLGAVTCPQTNLVPGEAMTCTAKVLTLTQAIVDAGVAANTATASGTGTNGVAVSAQDSTSTPIAEDPRIALDLTAGPIEDLDRNGIDAGDAITYAYRVTNTGNVTLSSVTVNDPTFGTFTCQVGSLAPGQSTTCTPPGGGRALLTAADIRAGRRVEQATASGRSPAGRVVSAADTEATPIQVPVLRLTKVANRTVVRAGQTLTFTLSVRNTGPVAARNVVLCDLLPNGLSVVNRGGGRLRAGRVCWTFNVNPGATVTRRLGVRVDRSRRPGRIVNRATLNGGPAVLVALRPISILPATGGRIPIVTG